MSSEIIFVLRDVLIRIGQFDFIIHVGLERNQDNDKDKIDLLVGCKEMNITHCFSQIQTALKDQWPLIRLAASDDAVRFDLDTSSGGIAVCDSAKLAKQIKEWAEGGNVSGQHCSWAIGFWIPEALCGDIATAEVLHDAKGIYTEMKELLVPYSESLAQTITAVCTDEVKQKLSKLNHLIREKRTIELRLCLADISAALVRLAFARSRHYLRGFESLREQAKFLQPLDFTLCQLATDLIQGKEMERIVDEIPKHL